MGNVFKSDNKFIYLKLQEKKKTKLVIYLFNIQNIEIRLILEMFFYIWCDVWKKLIHHNNVHISL